MAITRAIQLLLRRSVACGSDDREWKALFLVRFALFLARFARSVDLEPVRSCLVVESLSDTVFNFFDFRREELNGVTTGCADHMMVRTTVEAVFEPGHAITELHLSGQSTLGKESQCPIYSGIANGGMFLAHQVEQFLCCEVIAGCQEDTENYIAPRASFQPQLQQVLVKNFLGGRQQVLARPNIDSLLSHIR
jgi:hypothetical protein